MSRLRIVNLGLPKSGTTTLSRALRRAGFSVADWKVREHQSDDAAIVNEHVGALLYQGYFNTGDPLYHLEKFDAVNEMSVVRYDRNLWPQMDWGLIAAIQDNHPKTKFLLSRRDPVATAASMRQWHSMGNKRLPKLNVPGLPNGFGKQDGQLERWIEGHYRFCNRVFAGADNFFEFDIADPDASTKIGDFIGKPLPWWGRANNRSSKMTPDTEEVI